MVKMSVTDGEELTQCPYDNTHMVRWKRMPYHLRLCRKNFPNSELMACPFNAMHEVPRAELRFHSSQCADRYTIEQEMAGKDGASTAQYKGCTDVPEYKTHEVENSEDWEAEVRGQPKVFILGQSYKYDTAIVGPDDHSVTSGEEKDAETVTLLRQQYIKDQLSG